jgi:hypothetical protein
MAAPQRQHQLRARFLGLAMLGLAGLALALLEGRSDQALPPVATTPTPAPQETVLLESHQEALARGNDFALTPAMEPGLFAQLAAGDRAWIPRAERIPGGGVRYLYKKRADEPALTLDQIKDLIRHPPTFDGERNVIRGLLASLRSAGVAVQLAPPRKQGAAGEWEPAKGVLRIRPDIPMKGSREFARVLNHEAIHVAQSCSNGALTARPRSLGLSRDVDGLQLKHLNEPIYANASSEERSLEQEAYANQDNLQLGLQLIAAHCRRA